MTYGWDSVEFSFDGVEFSLDGADFSLDGVYFSRNGVSFDQNSVSFDLYSSCFGALCGRGLGREQRALGALTTIENRHRGEGNGKRAKKSA